MKIRLTIMTENDKHLDISKEELEQKTKVAWKLLLDMISNGDERAILEKCEVVEM